MLQVTSTCDAVESLAMFSVRWHAWLLKSSALVPDMQPCQIQNSRDIYNTMM